ncbi:uncharacterized protein JCM15063_005738 [Sporobolomyces koalae]|uniref:uncharacterized protein n=1 Tax=Sporobolomyces koalae TaxID=500713 RepID=UPI0031725F42
MVGVVPLAQAVYCSNPDAIASCWKLCPAADTVSIGVRLGCYIQAVAFFVLVLVAPDEGGAESLWLGLSVSFCFVASNYIMLWLHMITMHHTVVVILLSHLPYIATLSGLNSLTSYEVLGPAGVRFLQGGLIFKAISTAILWALCIWGYAAGKLPDWLHFQFRQVNCLEQTKLVLWFVPISRSQGMGNVDTFLLASYSIFWFLVLCAGSYWSLIAPIVLVKRGGHLRDPKKKKIRGFRHREQHDEDGRKDKHHDRDDPSDYTPESENGEEMLQLVMRSQPKNRPDRRKVAPSTSLSASASRDGSSFSLPSYTTESRGGLQASDVRGPELDQRPATLPSASDGMTALSTWSKGVRGTAQDAHLRWTRRQTESRHHFIIWPICALLLTFAIVTIELQMAMNDVFPGEMALDFPGVLTFFLALPTAWAVGKALRRIQEGRRPTPNERGDRSFLELAHVKSRSRKHRSRRSKAFSVGHAHQRDGYGTRRDGYDSEGTSDREVQRSSRSFV